MELRRGGGVGSQAVGRRMDGDGRDGGGGGGGGCKDAGSEDYENLPTSASVSTHMTAGAMAGILEHSVMYPVDSVKVRLGAPGRLSGILPAGRGGPRARACKQTFASCARVPDHAHTGPRASRAPRGSWGAQPGLRGAPLSCTFRRAPGLWGGAAGILRGLPKAHARAFPGDPYPHLDRASTRDPKVLSRGLLLVPAARCARGDPPVLRFRGKPARALNCW